MTDRFQEIAGLTHEPIRIVGSWIEKTVTTEPPRYVPHTEYALYFKLECDVEILLAVMLVDAGKGQFARSWRSAARREWNLRLSFFPMDWKRSDAVQVNFDGLYTNIDQASLKHNPRPLVTSPWLDGEHSVASGSILTAACVESWRRIECRVFTVAKLDTDANRGRWALKPVLGAALPEELRFLLSGATGGTF
jgi:hypothetical protein